VRKGCVFFLLVLLAFEERTRFARGCNCERRGLPTVNNSSDSWGHWLSGLLAVREVSRRRNCLPFVTDPPFWRVPTLAPENAKLICTPVVHHHHHHRRRRVFTCVRIVNISSFTGGSGLRRSSLCATSWCTKIQHDDFPQQTRGVAYCLCKTK
jgi:hypothetical protein